MEKRVKAPYSFRGGPHGCPRCDKVTNDHVDARPTPPPQPPRKNRQSPYFSSHHRNTYKALAVILIPALMQANTHPVLEAGPSAIREMFPLFLISLSYQAADPTPLGQGVFQAELDRMRANTFEFSSIFKYQMPTDQQGRIQLTREYIEAQAQQFAHLPLLFFFDGEVGRTTLHLRYGLTDKVDLWTRVSSQSIGGGRLDRLIEGFHSLGFEQFGRDRIAPNRITLVVIEHGNVRFYRDEPVGNRMQDPIVGFNALLTDTTRWTMTASCALKLPFTNTFGLFKSGWDQSYSITGRFEAHPRHIVFFGAGFVRRPRGNIAFSSFPFGSMRDGLGAHLAWEYRKSATWRPFVLLLWQSPYLHYQPNQSLHKPSLQHDLGVHWQFHPRTRLTLHYQNNITHKENTADMGLGLTLTRRF